MNPFLLAWVVAVVLVPWRVLAQCDPARVPAVGPAMTPRALAVYDGDLYAGAPSPGFVKRWNGSAWETVGTGDAVYAMAVYRGELVAAGKKRWDGSSWHPLDDEAPMNGNVFAMAPFNNELIMAGGFTRVGARPFNHIVRWNGTDWLPMGAGLDGEVSSLAVFNDEVIAGGTFFTSGGRVVNHLARWDGTQWHPVGGGVDGVVHGLVTYGGDLIAGGYFFSAGGTAIDSIARWDGAGWQPLGDGVMTGFPGASPIFALTVYRGQVIAGGYAGTAGGQPVRNIARWDGAAWHPVESDFSNPVYALTVHDHQLIAGGAFGPGLARWACPPCAADLDDDGHTDFTDYLAFLDLYSRGDADADLNGDGLVDSADWSIFFDAYAMGC